ncbi:MAG: hypothetical protein ACUVTH_14550, partial [Thermogutta sp.]
DSKLSQRDSGSKLPHSKAGACHPAQTCRRDGPRRPPRCLPRSTTQTARRICLSRIMATPGYGAKRVAQLQPTDDV